MNRRNFLTAALSLAAAFATRLARGQPVESKRAAVVIGVDKAGDFPKLKAARSSASSVAQWLTDEGFEVKLLVDDPADKTVTASDVFAAISRFVNRGTLEQLVLYFAGHGFVTGSSEYWLLSGAPDNPNEAISLLESRALALQCGIPNVIFISDACRSSADSLRAQYVKGSIVFPNRPVRGNVDLDVFLATRIGGLAWEAAVRDSVNTFEGIYTACFLDAFRSPYPDMIQVVDGKSVITNRKLKLYLAQQVPIIAKQKSIKLGQEPYAEVNSQDWMFIGHVLSPTRATPPAAIPTATVSDVANAAIGINLGGGSDPSIQLLSGSKDSSGSSATRPGGSVFGGLIGSSGLDDRSSSGSASGSSGSQNTIDAIAQRSGFKGARQAIVESRRLSTELVARTGFAVYGKGVQSITVRPGIKKNFRSSAIGRSYALIEVDLGDAQAASVAIRFAPDGAGTVLAAVNGFVGNVVVEDGCVKNVSYVPSRQSPKWSDYEHEAERLEELRGAVAASAQLGVFRLEGSRESRNKTAEQLTSRFMINKVIDPTLCLYAAYAYADAGIFNQVRSMQKYMREDLRTDLFDLLMLSGEMSGRAPSTAGGPYPFCPMLSQGWALLRVNNVRLHESVLAAGDHLRPSLWASLDHQGMDIVEKALRAGRVT